MTPPILRYFRHTLSFALAYLIALGTPSIASAEVVGKLMKGYAVYRGAKAMKKGYDVARKVITVKDRLQLAYQMRKWKDVAAIMRDDITFATRARITPKQFDEIVAHFTRNGGLRKLAPNDLAKARKAFQDDRGKILSAWSKATGKPWPMTKTTLQTQKGKVVSKAGQEYQPHHIVPLEYGGANAWWNIVPAEAGGAHQFGLHGTGSVLNLLSKII